MEIVIAVLAGILFFGFGEFLSGEREGFWNKSIHVAKMISFLMLMVLVLVGAVMLVGEIFPPDETSSPSDEPNCYQTRGGYECS